MFAKVLDLEGNNVKMNIRIPTRSIAKKGQRDAPNQKWNESGELQYIDPNKYSCIWGFYSTNPERRPEGSNFAWFAGSSQSPINSGVGERYSVTETEITNPSQTSIRYLDIEDSPYLELWSTLPGGENIITSYSDEYCSDVGTKKAPACPFG